MKIAFTTIAITSLLLLGGCSSQYTAEWQQKVLEENLAHPYSFQQKPATTINPPTFYVCGDKMNPESCKPITTIDNTAAIPKKKKPLRHKTSQTQQPKEHQAATSSSNQQKKRGNTARKRKAASSNNNFPGSNNTCKCDSTQ